MAAGKTAANRCCNRAFGGPSPSGAETRLRLRRCAKKIVASNGLTTTTYYVGNWLEVREGVTTTYYYLGSQRVAMRQTAAGQQDQVTYLHSDHLGSTSAWSGSNSISQTYYPFGLVRTTTGTLPTEFGYTGQRHDRSTAQNTAGTDGLLYYGARYYDSYLNRWAQADTIVPNLYNPQSYNRYSYTYNNPVRYYDRDGHCFPFCLIGAALLRVMPRELVAAGSRFVADQKIPVASDLAALDANTADNYWLAVNGDRVGLSPEQRVAALGSAADGSIKEAAIIYGAVEGGVALLAGAGATMQQSGMILDNSALFRAGSQTIDVASGASLAIAGKTSPRTKAAPAPDTTGGHRPPGWDETWSQDYGTRLGQTGLRDRDPQGGEWRWHEDARHDGHWHYNPWNVWNDNWINVDKDGNPIPK